MDGLNYIGQLQVIQEKDKIPVLPIPKAFFTDLSNFDRLTLKGLGSEVGLLISRRGKKSMKIVNKDNLYYLPKTMYRALGSPEKFNLYEIKGEFESILLAPLYKIN